MGFSVILLISFGVLFVTGYYDSHKTDSIAKPPSSVQK